MEITSLFSCFYLDKICCPAQYLKACKEMLEVPTKSKAQLECVAARDR